MAGIDLHTHSHVSDGTLSPAALVAAAQAAGLEALALTDHDTVDGLAAARSAAAAVGLEFVAGVELAVRWEGFSMDLLGLWLPVPARNLSATLEWLNGQRRQRNEQIVARLQELGVAVTYPDVVQRAGGTVGRPHIAQAIVAAGKASSVQEAFDRYLGSQGKAYVPKLQLTPDKALTLLQDEGASVFLAHPFLYRMDERRLRLALDHLQELGLDGLEAYHSDHSPSQTATCLQWARQRGLLVTGGSDFHGDIKPDIRLGVGRGRTHVPYSVLQTLKDHRVQAGLPV